MYLPNSKFAAHVAYACVFTGTLLFSVPGGAQTITADQLQLDVTPVPSGLGALFVPALTSSDKEANVVVKRNGERAATSTTGERIILPPGTYEVSINQGPEAIRPRTTVRVTDSSTAPIEPFFAAVRIHAVDIGAQRPTVLDWVVEVDKNDVANGETEAAGSFAATTTTLVRPGILTIRLPKSDTAIDLKVVAGEVVDYRILMDGADVLGGEYALEEINYAEKWWQLRWTIGADIAFNSSSNSVSNFNGEYVQLGVFSDTQVGVNVKNHVALLGLTFDEAWVGLSSDVGASVPTRKLVDEARASVLYNYRLGGIVGPYAQATGQASLFASRFYAERDTSVLRGDTTIATVAAGDERTLVNGAYPLYLQEGAGVSITVVDNSTVDIGLRAGAALRQARFDGGEFIDRFSDGTIRVQTFDDTDEYGTEGHVNVGIRLGRSFRIKADLDMFVPSDQLVGNDDMDPIYRVSGLAELTLNSFASLTYRATLARDNLQSPRADFQGISLRLQHTLF